LVKRVRGIVLASVAKGQADSPIRDSLTGVHINGMEPGLARKPDNVPRVDGILLIGDH